MTGINLRNESMYKITALYGSGLLDENSYIITDETSGKSAVIDPSFSNVNEIAEKYDITHILLTHGHFDHVASVDALKSLTGAEVIIHEDDLDLLKNPLMNLSPVVGMNISLTADSAVKDGEKINVGDTEFTVIHTPGHTPGSVCYICGGAMFTGDTLFKDSIGRTDFPSSSYESMLGSLKRLYELETDYILYPGHDEASTLFAEKANNRYF